jgi:murein DD-endopeptidase MepM/ murein hydrolase activator NlpD
MSPRRAVFYARRSNVCAASVDPICSGIRRQQLLRFYNRSETGAGKGVIFLAVAFLLVVVGLGWKLASTQAPTLQLLVPLKGIGQKTELQIAARDPKHNVKRLEVQVIQGTQAIHSVSQDVPLAPHRWWKFWSRGPESVATWTVPVGRQAIPDLKEGRATVRITATNDSWGRFFRGGQSLLVLDLPVRFIPPQVEVLTSQHYVNQGGCDMVLFKVSPGTVRSGVQVGDYFFPSWPVKESMDETRLCVFAYPYNVDPSTPARILARDDADNETVTNFNYKVFPKKFHSDTINLTDDFMNRVVPPIMSQTPELNDQGSLLKNFLLVNGTLRQMDAKQLIAFSQKTSQQFTWTQPFVPLGNAQVEASFADFRTYMYNGQVVDHQTHLGFDLAVVQHTPVVAANDGTVVFAGYFGIYGNTIVIDHGCGLQSLYAHLSSSAVKEGDQVKREQVIAHSGQTGLAGGDHLHFTMLLDGLPVNPVEWWDPHWIHDRIEAKLQPYR